jgi:hypothetical protein
MDWSQDTIAKLSIVAKFFPNQSVSELTEAVVSQWCDDILAKQGLDEHLEEIWLTE